MAKPEETIGAGCPSRGKFYVCEASGFVGCCSEDPCQTSDGLCGDDDLAPMTFNPEKYKEIPAQDCQGRNPDIEWYVCTSTKPFPFMGCCATNPCSEGSCPDGQLRGSKLSSNEKNTHIFLGGDSTRTSSGPTTSSASTSTVAEPTSSSSDPGSGSDSGGLPQGAIIGIAVGATAVGILAIGLFLFWFWRKARQSREQADACKGPLMGFGAGGRENSQFQDMKYQSQYSPKTGSFQGLQSPQSSNFTHPNSPQPYHDRASYHAAMSFPPGLHAPPSGHHQWAGSPPPEQQSFLGVSGTYGHSPPAHVTSFSANARENAPVELPLSIAQQRSELSDVSELPANPNTVSMQSYSRVPGRESEISGGSRDGRYSNEL
ncbi:hypothetical protein NLU13_5895 [Sarocladium strictum]|uniref:Uncharacterized protein n=1 Tax=Sarocladium strictum TaxID=5046 RepID=A0AA39L6L3_SARSR|nr:hypothetical protein NLU13_5895 [Sarocladium strictum]